MKTIYLMRHGETLFNVMDVNQGQCDSPLTAAGIAQAKQAGEWFRAHHVLFDAVYSSTAERACDTAELVAGLPYTRRKGLKEIFWAPKRPPQTPTTRPTPTATTSCHLAAKTSTPSPGGSTAL